MFFTIGVLGFSVFAHGQGKHESDVRGRLNSLEQGVEKGRELTTGTGVCLFHLPKIDRHLVDHDQGWLAAEEFAKGLGPGGDVPLIAFLDSAIALGSGKPVGQLTPEGLRPQARLQGARPLAGSLFSPSNDPAHPNLGPGQQGRVHEFLDLPDLDPDHSPDGVNQRDEAVGLCRPRIGCPGG